MTDNLRFVSLLSGLFALAGVVMWLLDSPVEGLGPQMAAFEGLVMASVGGAVSIVAFAMKQKRHEAEAKPRLD